MSSPKAPKARDICAIICNLSLEACETLDKSRREPPEDRLTLIRRLEAIICLAPKRSGETASRESCRPNPQEVRAGEGPPRGGRGEAPISRGAISSEWQRGSPQERPAQ